MIEGKTKTGFSFKIDEEVIGNDFDLLILFGELDEETNIAKSSYVLNKVAKKLLGADGYRQLREHCSNNGRVSSEKMLQAISDILNYNQETKNS